MFRVQTHPWLCQPEQSIHHDRNDPNRAPWRFRPKLIKGDASRRVCIATVRSAMDSMWRKWLDQFLFLIPDIINAWKVVKQPYDLGSLWRNLNEKIVWQLLQGYAVEAA